MGVYVFLMIKSLHILFHFIYIIILRNIDTNLYSHCHGNLVPLQDCPHIFETEPCLNQQAHNTRSQPDTETSSKALSLSLSE